VEDTVAELMPGMRVLLLEYLALRTCVLVRELPCCSCSARCENEKINAVVDSCQYGLSA